MSIAYKILLNIQDPTSEMNYLYGYSPVNKDTYYSKNKDGHRK